MKHLTEKRKFSEGKFPITYVQWFDSAMSYDMSDTTIENVGDYLHNETVGFLIKESPEAVTLAFDHCMETDHVRGTLVIPRVNIVKIKIFSCGKNFRRGSGQKNCS